MRTVAHSDRQDMVAGLRRLRNGACDEEPGQRDGSHNTKRSAVHRSRCRRQARVRDRFSAGEPEAHIYAEPAGPY
jgi:hypothetical protein